MVKQILEITKVQNIKGHILHQIHFLALTDWLFLPKSFSKCVCLHNVALMWLKKLLSQIVLIRSIFNQKHSLSVGK